MDCHTRNDPDEKAVREDEAPASNYILTQHQGRIQTSRFENLPDSIVWLVMDVNDVNLNAALRQVNKALARRLAPYIFRNVCAFANIFWGNLDSVLWKMSSLSIACYIKVLTIRVSYSNTHRSFKTVDGIADGNHDSRSLDNCFRQLEGLTVTHDTTSQTSQVNRAFNDATSNRINRVLRLTSQLRSLHLNFGGFQRAFEKCLAETRWSKLTKLTLENAFFTHGQMTRLLFTAARSLQEVNLISVQPMDCSFALVWELLASTTCINRLVIKCDNDDDFTEAFDALRDVLNAPRSRTRTIEMSTNTRTSMVWTFTEA